MSCNFYVDRARRDKRAKGAGEDAPPVAKNGILVICDGTGATGVVKHKIDGTVHTSAYLGSRATSKITEDYLSANYDGIFEAVSSSSRFENYAEELGRRIRDGLVRFVNEHGLSLGSEGGISFSLLPTTLAAAVYKESSDGVEVVVFSAGDSRVLLWEPENGLQQLSVDDVAAGYDAFCDNSNTTNCISADREFRINCIYHKLSYKKCILFATSDGFTDPVKPFEQEDYLIRFLSNCDNIIDENNSFGEYIGDRFDAIGFSSADDCSMAGAIIGYSDNSEIKKVLGKRYEYVNKSFGEKYRAALSACQSETAVCNILKRETDKLGRQVNESLKAEITEKSPFLLSKTELNEAEKKVCDFLMKQPYICEAKRYIENELAAKRKKAEGELAKAKVNEKNAFVEWYRQRCLIEAKLDKCSSAYVPDYIADAIRTKYQNEASIKEVNETISNLCMRYEVFKKRSLSELSFEELYEYRKECDYYADVVSDGFCQKQMLKNLENSVSRSEKIIDSFFADGNEEISKAYNAYCNNEYVDKKNIFKDFVTWKHREEKDRLDRLERDLQSATAAVKSCNKAVENTSLSDEEKRKQYESVIRSHINELANAVNANSEIFGFMVTAHCFDEYNAKFSEFKSSEDRLKKLIEEKAAPWKEYKVGYELFNKAQWSFSKRIM